MIKELLIKNYNVILHGPPGTGKTYLAKQIAEKITGDSRENIGKENARIGFVQFHPSFDYTDFVEGLRPVQKNGEIVFELKDGVFREFCNRAKNDPGHKYVFIIDEINRAEISKVFGELFYALDPGYRGAKGSVLTQYSNLRADNDKKFHIPENVYILGTMNDIDRSVDTFDFAIRRRFVWKEITAEASIPMLYNELDKKIAEGAEKKLRALNNAISEIDGLNRNYHIGASYFLKLKEYNGDYQKLWKLHLEPLLREYLRAFPDAEEKMKKLTDTYNKG